MQPEPWTQRIVTWRATPDGARARARWARIPRNVAESMAFEREDVPLTTLEDWHANTDDLDTAGPEEPLQDITDYRSAIAHQVLTLERQIEQAQFDTRALDDELVRDLHTAICEHVAPRLVGWRRIEVAVGSHIAPAWPLVPALMRDYGRDLEARIAAQGLDPTERLLETLAFAEGRLLSIHPFADYNGRVTRVFLRLLLRRQKLPPVRLAPGDDERANYLTALSAADRSDWNPLIQVWMHRLAPKPPPMSKSDH
jgi:Fic family protein